MATPPSLDTRPIYALAPKDLNPTSSGQEKAKCVISMLASLQVYLQRRYS